MGKTRKARALVKTGAVPATRYGHQAVGLAPTAMLALRRDMSYSMAFGGKGNCTTTVLALTSGPSEDPEVSYRVDSLQHWFAFWNKSPHLHRDVNTVWQKVVRGTLDSKSPWSRVTSLLSNTIATLLHVGVYPLRPDCWVIPEGTGGTSSFAFPMPAGIKTPKTGESITGFLQHFRAALHSKLMQKAATHRNGQGMAEGIDFSYTTKYYRYLYEKGRYKDAGILYALASAGLWPAERRESGSDLCPRCGLKNETDYHLIYECTCNIDPVRDTIDDNGETIEQEDTILEDRVFRATKRLTKNAKTGLSSFPVLLD